MRVSIVDAFTRTPGAGNRAGVVLEAAKLEAAEMQRIAASVAASETAFVVSAPAEGRVRLRYFSPVAEVDFCGHATVAALHVLSEQGLLARQGPCQLECSVGTYSVELEPVDAQHSRAWIVTPQTPWKDSPVPIETVMPLLGGTVQMVDRSLPVQFTGYKLFVPIARRDELWTLFPRSQPLVEATVPHGIRGVFLFTRETVDPQHAVQSRFFAPAFGIPEDPVTGSASGVLAVYLVTHGVLKAPRPGEVLRARVEQGDAMGKPGRVDLEVLGEAGAVSRARIGGVAVTVFEGNLRA
ncbi:PhzF family phenazine biosynthesis protein [Stigmatella aurantiaca]|uniref:Phenazine biosynthesis protein PhzF family n=1 Tax=Stigmatella aurantiaca (strain DW4/3-1) TaxID=378806 RepID=E3FR35_STIAD|nr:PhzF family phenazine biosynthesis isomerase [Stigmatella aurantiaca]ADO73254.1 Phenazine biosynthesis protein PhzF family [Stigmatella aurantiaca DW4/3-1]